MVHRSLNSALEEMLASIAHVLLRIRAQEDNEAAQRTLRAHLLERDPGIEAANDDLYAVGKELRRPRRIRRQCWTGRPRSQRSSGLVSAG